MSSNLEVVEFAKSAEEKLKSLENRIYKEHSDERGANRCPFMRDYARILYSSSFRRLQGKMQLLGVNPTNFNRNRLTHSLEVAQIARSMSVYLGLEKSVVAEGAALAHDIGNPPFGHSGEVVLNKAASGIGGYEGNAQAFRLLHRLEHKSSDFEGLNLSIRTLLGITKYFNRSSNPEKFLYDEDYCTLKNKLDEYGVPREKSIDAQIMDLADEIAYAAHDLEDALGSSMLSVGEMVYEFKISKDYDKAHGKFKDIVQKAQEIANRANNLKTSEEYSIVLKKEITSEIVNTLVRDINVVQEDGIYKLGYKQHGLLAKGLKKLLFNAILRKTEVQLYEKMGEKVLIGLLEVYNDKNYNKDLILLPAELRALDNGNKCQQERLIIDYISGMMDTFAIKQYEKFFGKAALERHYY
jgi:predicted deoxyguanosinetriphosphate triphosphohydrolase